MAPHEIAMELPEKAMVTYVPVLKGRQAEFWSWRYAGHDVVGGSRVLFEVVPSRGADRDLNDFVNQASVSAHADEVLSVDTGYLDQTQPVPGTGDGPVLWAARAFHARGIPIRPVFRLDDDPAVLAEIGAAVALHERGACLRLGSVEADPDPDEAAALAPDALGATGLDSSSVHLIIDFGEVASDRAVPRAGTVAQSVVDWVVANPPWASVTLLAGAFPSSVSHLPRGAATPVPRYDAAFFEYVARSRPNAGLDYGDYVIWHPEMSAAAPYAPLPNLRHAHDRDWQVYREARALPGNESFFTLCVRVVGSPYWPAAGQAYSRGDAEIDRCAKSQGGPGRATEWLRYGASHHIAHISERLRTLGVP